MHPPAPQSMRFFLNAFYLSIFLNAFYRSIFPINAFYRSIFPINAFYRSIFLVYEKIYWNKFCMYFLPAICAIRSSCHRNGYNLSRDSKSCCWSGHSALQATRRMPLWTLAIALATGKNTRLFGWLDQNMTRFSTYVSQRAESKAATVTTND